MIKIQRTLRLILVCCLVLTLLPMQAFAAEQIVTEVVADKEPMDAVAEAASLPRLGRPADLYWSNGYMNWTMTEPHHFKAETKLYKVGQSNPISTFGHGWQNNNSHSFNALQSYVPEDGASYYFTVQAISNNSSYRNSEIATSPIWTFVQPDEALDACSNVRFDGQMLTWTPPAGTDSTTTYTYRFLYANNADLNTAVVRHLNFMRGPFNGSANVREQNSWAYTDMDIGYYFTEVRAESKDISAKYHGPWTISNLVYFNGSSFEILEAPHIPIYQHTVIEPTCTAQGYTLHTCDCGDSFADRFVYATGLHIFTDDQDTSCNTCGLERELRQERPVVHMFRMYDPNSGEHFYTGSEEERENLIKAGWNYEGVGFTFPLTTGDPVHRLYDPVTGEHLFTRDMDEVNKLVAAGWNKEGVAFNSDSKEEVPQYRLHNPNATVGAYHYTGSVEERDHLISLGWEDQGITWYSCWK